MRRHLKIVEGALGIDDPAEEALPITMFGGSSMFRVQARGRRVKHIKKLKIKIHFMKVKNKIDQHCKQLHLSALGAQVEQLADAAASEGISYLEFAGRLLEVEIANRNKNEMLRKIKFAKLPAMHDLQAYDCAQAEGMPPAKLQQLKELTWLDQNFNLVIMGPNGVGKSLLAAGHAWPVTLQT